MQSEFSSKINFKRVECVDARDVLTLSFLAQNSLLYLNLEGGEGILGRRFIFTEEDCRKVFDPRRNILYKYHLDLPRGLENSLRCNDNENIASHFHIDEEDNDSAFYLKGIKVCESVYNQGLEHGILDDIMSSDDKIEKIKKYLNTMKMLKFDKSRVEVKNFLYDHILGVLHPNCHDSGLVMKCVKMFDFSNWIFDRQDTRILKYVLYHAQQMRQDLWRICNKTLDPINGCIYHLKYKNVGPLIKYGAPLNFQYGFYARLLRLNYPEERYVHHVVQKAKTEKRMFLLLQFYYVYMFSPKAVRSLRYIWRSIPEPYFSYEEILSVFNGVIPKHQVKNMAACYSSKVLEETPFGMKIIPRSLRHLCRVAIRRRLNRNLNLPLGISRLPMPKILKAYLNIQSKLNLLS